MKSLDLESVRWGLFIASLGLLMGVYLGIHFGKSEDAIHKYLENKAASSSYYASGDKTPKDAVKDGWKYLKRSHEHFQGLGAISIALILLLSGMWLKRSLKSLISIGIGLGATVYPLFWYLVAYRVADVGKHDAKESLALMAQFGAGVYFLSFIALFLTLLAYAIWKDDQPGFLASLKE